MGFFDTPEQLETPEGGVTWPLMAGFRGAAQFSKDRVYRHSLTRTRVGSVKSNYALWIGMNPSKACADRDDPTVRRELIYTVRWLPVNQYVKGNVCDYCATDPEDMLAARRPVSTRNLIVLARLVRDADVIIAAWGNMKSHPALRGYVADVEALLRSQAQVRVQCLALNDNGSPKHPLYVKGDTPLMDYPLKK